MAKGKKNKKGDDKKKEPVESALSSLTLASTSEESTSQGGQGDAEGEFSGGLTGGGRKQKPAAEKTVTPTPEATTAPANPDTSKLEEEAPKPTPENETEEKGGLGLERTGPKRNRTRKKKPNLAQAEALGQPPSQSALPASSTTSVQGPSQSRPPQGGTPQPTSQGPPQARQGPPQPGQWSTPQPSSQGAPQARQGPPQPGPWGTQPSSQGPPQARQGQPQSGQWGTPQPSSQGPPQARQGPPQPGQWGTPQPTSQGPPQARQGPPQPRPWGTPQLSTQGPPPGWSGSAGPSSSASNQSAPSQQRAGPPISAQPQQAATSPPPSAVAVYAAPRQEAPCKYTIPAKIMGNSIRTRIDRVITNYLPMTIKAIKVHRYDVAFEPSRPKKMIPQVYKIVKDKYYPNEYIAFDQVKNCYSLRPLKNVGNSESRSKEEIKFAVDFKDPNDRIMTFTVAFKLTGIVDLGRLHEHLRNQGSSLNPPTDAIQCVDVILRQGALESYVRCGRNFFKRPERPIGLTGGLEMWTGLFQSAIFTSTPFINVDVAHKGFPICQTMVEAWKSFRLDVNKPLENQMPRDAESFKDFAKNLKVVVKILMPGGASQTREYTINSLVERPGKIEFHHEQLNRKISVLNYYKEDKKYNIQYPNLPCLWVGPRTKTMYFPMELASVSYGQPINKQLNEFQLSNMVKEAATPPHIRKQKIEDCVRSMNYNTNNFFKAFGLEISNKFMEVDAKILNAPILATGDGTTQPRNGSWNAQKLLKPEALTAWGFFAVELSRDQCNYEGIAKLVAQTGNQVGMLVKPPLMSEFNIKLHELRNFLFRAVEMNIRLVFIIVSTRGRDHYHKAKQMAECEVGILTQCIKENTATRRMNHQTMKNILLKVNSKLMGINQSLNNTSLPRCIQNGGVMVVGADVTHPAPDSNIPSIAAVTASMDPKCFIYNIEMSIQEPKTEMILHFEDMMGDHLKLWIERNNRQVPKKIYVFRDGVSEGQFKAVMENELAGLYRAYQRFSKEKPEVLFLLVQKRHHTRLFAQDRNRGIVNVEPGTVVDTVIVHPKEMDFYLVSHQAIKGTARPTRYHTICNDGSIPTDEVEQLTFYLCHLYSRCMRSVSYPTPTYYAHLACLRARSLTYGRTFDINQLRNQPQRLRVMDKMLRSSRMFFV